MANNNVTFTINFEGNAEVKTENLVRAVGTLKGVMSTLEGIMVKVGARVMVFNQLTDSIRSVVDSMAEMSAPGMALDSAMHDLSSITGVVGQQLKEIEGYARSAAKTFGGSAADSVEAYKLILSQLSPEIAKVPSALSAMGQSVSILSKTMGGDTAAAVEVLTTAMNQFQVSTDNPTAAATEMARMMNVMAAAAQAGSAELPAIKAALEQSGMAAKSAAVSFEETNAAIQVLDKAGKKASEGGVALRNILTTLAQGRFLPADTVQELAAAGIDVDALADKSLTLSERLRILKPLLNDDALLAKLFGRETYNAALALISGTDALDEYTAAVTGTRSAEEQAAIVMESRQEQLARYKARIDDLKIAIFNGLGGLYPYAQALSDILVPLSQMLPLMDLLRVGLVKAVSLFKASAVAIKLKSAAMTAATAVTGLYRSALSALTVALGSARMATAALAATMTMGLSLAITGVISLIARLSSKRSETTGSVNEAAEAENSYMESVTAARSELSLFISRLKTFQGSREDELAMVSELNSRYGESMGTYGSVAAWYDTLVAKSESYIALMVAEAKARTLADKIARREIKTDGLSSDLENVPEYVERPGSSPVRNPAYDITATLLEKEKSLLTSHRDELEKVMLEIGQIRASLRSSGNGNTSTETTSDAYGRLEKRIAQTVRINAIFGQSNNDLTDSIRLTKQAIEQYIMSGETEESLLVRLIAKYRELLDARNAAYVPDRSGGIKAVEHDVKPDLTSGISLPGIDYSNLDNYVSRMDKVKGVMKGVMEIMSPIVGMMNDVAHAVGGAAGSWMQYGANVLNAAGQAIAAIIPLVAAQKLKNQTDAEGAVISSANAVAGIPVVGPILAAAAIASMIAALFAIPKFAKGGIVSGPTMALVGEYSGASNNPEVIAPLSRLKDLIGHTGGIDGKVVFEIRGRNLIGILEKENRHNTRTK